ncbi:hypothetical protein KZO01_08360 [Kurthia zopfii]|uniref:Uncharacterized conserved protein n=1 Tax=Kurthia zopfii TaxID=1650 RepID=A0A8B4QE81_9BACL|nr:DUF1641 domain-containing protein [Kurthia zopfii]PWI22269.1 hypothetical protein DF281_07880 [Kurthia zopfii]TDR37917.1 uncharacterized protein YjgD (DUF1641 family) [Kurthia zopfii]GEK30527.1 hypothetical protein KZO01_08360 [Kurthia zopfii]STX11066.1 Uncharacterized conserved protein [Kurthia zopfii]
MATPINSIRKNVLTDEQITEQKLDSLKQLVSENDSAVQQILKLVGELDSIGALEAANKMLEAKEEVANIALGQLTSKPVTNMINNMMGAAGALASLDPAVTEKLVGGLMSGVDEANKAVAENDKISTFQLVRMMKDPDVNRAMNFGIHFLKGLGSNLK